MKRLAIALTLFLSACATDGPETYGVGTVGIQHRQVTGRIISSEPTVIDLSNGEAGQGAWAGGLIGGASNSGSDASGIIAAVIIGAAIGAAIGADAEARQRTPGYAYLVETTNGARIAFVQPGGQDISAGTPVTVVYGPPARLIMQ